MFKLQSQTIPWANDVQIRVEQKGIGIQSYLECGLWKKNGIKWEKSEPCIEIPLSEAVAVSNECEVFLRLAKHNKRKQSDLEQLQTLQTELSKQRDRIRIQVLKANTKLVEKHFAEQYPNG